jgi:hypothetical protein
LSCNFYGRGIDRPEFRTIKFLTAKGKPLQRVHNNSGTILKEPVSVELPPGKYQDIARANGYRSVIVPIMIETQQGTVLHLEGGGFWSGESLFSQTNALHLPDGQIIQWKAADNLYLSRKPVPQIDF